MISIVTITYNNFDQLIKTLNSIPKLNLIESVVINGGQCNKTSEFLRNYSGKSISEKDEGIADAFNKGVKLATGKYIMFLNSGDELIDKSYPLKAIEILNSSDEFNFVHSNLIFNDQHGTELYVKPQMKSLGRGMPYLHPTMIVRKKLFDQIGYFNTKLKIAMDFDWVARLEKNNISGNYCGGSYVIKMDGEGKSVIEEAAAISECYSILKSNGLLNPRNYLGFKVRQILYFFRVLIIKIGLKNFLSSLKKIKYSK
jgi:glycosyltransferase